MSSIKKYFSFVIPVLVLGVCFVILTKTDVSAKKKSKAKVRASITLVLEKETQSGQEKVKISGKVTPAKAGVRVTIYQKIGKKKYKRMTTVRTVSDGGYSHYSNLNNQIKSIQVKATVSKKKVSRTSAYNTGTMNTINNNSNANSGGENSGDGGGSSDSGSSNNSNSNNSSSSLSACGSQTEFFSAYPISIDNTTDIAPLGNVNPSGHVFPTDHIYFYITKSNPADPNSAPIETPLYSPGNVRLTEIDVTEHLSESPTYSDYTLVFYACDNIYFKFSHVTSLTQNLLSLISPPYISDNTYETGGKTFHMYNKTVSLDLNAGEEIGTAGGRSGQNALDFYAYDQQNVSLTFANSSRWYDFTKSTACPIDYYTTDKKTILRSKLGYGGYQRTTEPVCGRIDQDISGTAKGAWFKVGSPSHPEDPHLALVDYNINPSYQIISVGTSMSASGLSANSYSFTPTSSGSVNLGFQYLNTGSGVVCYNLSSGSILLFQLTSSTTLRAEKQSASECGSGPWSFTGNYTDFER